MTYYVIGEHGLTITQIVINARNVQLPCEKHKSRRESFTELLAVAFRVFKSLTNNYHHALILIVFAPKPTFSNYYLSQLTADVLAGCSVKHIS